MFETFVKQFIDIMDERAPVTIVSSRMDMPLGAVEADQSTLIHTRLDLLDDASPSADIVVSTQESMCQFDYIVHVPANNNITDEQFVRRAHEAAQVDSVSIVHSIDGGHDNTYVVTGHANIDWSENQNSNTYTHQLSAQLVSLMKAGGYDPEYADDTRVAEDVVTWSPE